MPCCDNIKYHNRVNLVRNCPAFKTDKLPAKLSRFHCTFQVVLFTLCYGNFFFLLRISLFLFLWCLCLLIFSNIPGSVLFARSLWVWRGLRWTVLFMFTGLCSTKIADNFRILVFFEVNLESIVKFCKFIFWNYS